MEELALWVVTFLAQYPYGVFGLTIIGSITVIASLVVPPIVKFTETKKDDEIWMKISENKLVRVICKVTKSFSVFQPKNN